MEAGWLIENNVFESCPQGVYLNGGRENIVRRNTFINCSNFGFGLIHDLKCTCTYSKAAHGHVRVVLTA